MKAIFLAHCIVIGGLLNGLAFAMQQEAKLLQPSDLYPAFDTVFYQRCAMQFLYEIAKPADDMQRAVLRAYLSDARELFESVEARLRVQIQENGANNLLEDYLACEKKLDHEAIGWRFSSKQRGQCFDAHLEFVFARCVQIVRMLAQIKNCVSPKDFEQVLRAEKPLTCGLQQNMYNARDRYAQTLPMVVEAWILLTEACAFCRELLALLSGTDSAGQGCYTTAQ